MAGPWFAAHSRWCRASCSAGGCGGCSGRREGTRSKGARVAGFRVNGVSSRLLKLTEGEVIGNEESVAIWRGDGSIAVVAGDMADPARHVIHRKDAKTPITRLTPAVTH